MFIPGSSPLRYTEGMRSRGFLAILLTLLALTSPADAQWRYPAYGAGVRGLSEILPGIRRTYPGRFYDAEGPYADPAGNMHYRIKWLTPEGRVIWLDTDARTGRVIGPAGYPSGVPGAMRPVGPPLVRGYPPATWRRPGFNGWQGRGGGPWPHH
jgi:hypothetical protein